MSVEETILEMWQHDDPDLVFIVKGEWEHDYKEYWNKESIVLYEGKYYAIYQTRTGGYHSYYNYGDPHVSEVTPVKREVIDYVRV